MKVNGSCHCIDCQRLTGPPVGVNILTLPGTFRVVARLLPRTPTL